MPLFQPSWLARQLDLVEVHIRKSTRSKEAILDRAAGELAASGGKRLRPALTILGGTFGPEPTEALTEVAAAVELLHMATLVHDDIIDDAPTRRGKPTVQSTYGKDVAVFAGDFLLTKALLLLVNARADERMQELARTMVHICEGEVTQYAHRFRRVGTLAYLKRIHGKTAALFGLSAAAGGRQAGAEESICKALARYGINFGMAFQIYDDILDYTSESETLGKPVGHDILSGVYTLPLLYALQSAEVATALGELLELREMVPAARVVELVRCTDGLARTQALLQKYVQKAWQALDGLPACESRDLLRALPVELFRL